jgi:hypothetical protein
MLIALALLQQAPQPDGTQLALLVLGCALFTVALMVYIFQPTNVLHPEAKTRLMYLYERMEQEAAAVLAEIDQLERAALKPYTYPEKDPSNKGARA